MSVPFLQNASGLSAEASADRIRRAHAEYDETRCVGWMLASGMRPKVDGVTLAKTPQAVELKSIPKPHLGCDVHPVVD